MSDLKPHTAVAAFFEDDRVRAALTGSYSAAVPDLLDEFRATCSYADCSTEQLLSLSELAAQYRNDIVAEQALRAAIATGALLHLAHHRLGSLLLSQGLHAEAAAQFDAGIAADPAFAPNYMGGACARHALGLKQEAAPYAERFIAFNLRPQGSADAAVLGDLGDMLFDAGQRERALPIYALLHHFGGHNARHVVRLAEAQMAEHHFAEAAAMLQAQIACGGPDAGINRTLALCLSQNGDHAAAMFHALEALQAEPANQGIIGTFVRVTGKSGDPAAIRNAMTAQAAVMSPSDMVEMAVRLHVAEGDAAAAVETVMAADFEPASRIYHLGVETAYAALNATAFAAATALAGKLQAISPDDTIVKVLRIDILFRQLRWEEAGEVLATIPPSETERPQVTMKRLEHACFCSDPETAATAAARLETRAGGNRQFMLPVLRYHAERQDWNGVMDRALPWLSASFNYAQIGYLLFRAAKYTGRQGEMLEAIQAIPGWDQSAGLLHLRNGIVCDRMRSAAEADALLADPAIAGNATMRERLALQRDVLAAIGGDATSGGEPALPHGAPEAATRDGPRDVVFLCTDRNYLCATIVALHGLAQEAAAGALDFFIVADDDIADMADRAAMPFRRVGIGVTVMPASSIVGSAERLFPAYGLFTSGHKLASAAYYRIYFAKHLKSLGHYDRALYVDSDVLLTGSLEALLRLDLTGRPLAARLETPRAEVRRAIAHHRLAEGQYFNSGVLLMDLRHPGLETALDASVAAIADARVRLLYHDQCALNLGFRDSFAALDTVWNYSVEERTKTADIPAAASLLHFLARPKPWSAAYNGEAGPLWFAKYRDTAAFIGEELATSMFRLIQD